MPIPETLYPPQPRRDRAPAVLHALSDPVRLLMVRDLAGAVADRSCRSFDVPVTKSTCTHHFKVLREAGIIHQRQEGTDGVNALREEDLEAASRACSRHILSRRRAGGRFRSRLGNQHDLAVGPPRLERGWAAAASASGKRCRRAGRGVRPLRPRARRSPARAGRRGG